MKQSDITMREKQDGYVVDLGFADSEFWFYGLKNAETAIELARLAFRLGQEEGKR